MSAAGTIPSTVGWALVLVGPVLSGVVFLIVRRRRGSQKLGAGAAACTGLLWFVLTADSVPPGWTAFWQAHSISAGLIVSVLIVAAAWAFIDERLAQRRLATMLSTWKLWLEGQRAFLSAIADTPPTPAVPVIAQHLRAADLLSRLMVQQQWTASMFTISALRADDGGVSLIAPLGELRDVGTDAIREFARLQIALDRISSEDLSTQDIDALWRAPLFQLGRLLRIVETLADSVRAEHWTAQAGTGQMPTHDSVDVDAMHVSGARSWTD